MSICGTILTGSCTIYISSDRLSSPLAQGVSGWAELYALQKWVDFVNQNPSDLRKSFIASYVLNAVLQKNAKLNPAAPMHYINRYTLQDNVINGSSPIYLSLADVYLIRAEAYAKIEDAASALADVNLICTRAGLTRTALYSNANLGSKSLLDVVLEERFLELAFEGHRVYDLFRKNRPMVRDYAGTHSQNNTPTTNTHQEVLPSENRVVS